MCVKPVPDIGNLSVSASQNRVFEKGKRLVNPLDEAAIEVAVGLGETAAVTVGIDEDIDIVRGALARGATRGILVTHPEGRGFDAVVIARILGALVRAEKPDQVVFGMGWPEGALGQVGFRVKEETDRPVTIVPPKGAVKLPSALAIMKAMKKEIRKISAADLGVDLASPTAVRSMGLA